MLFALCSTPPRLGRPAWLGLLGTMASVAALARQDVPHDLSVNMLGLPAEPMAFFNGFVLGLLSGLPDKHKLAFTMGSAGLAIDITAR